MINKLEIRNFKSLKELNLACKKINVFIGEPNTGKSNILETLGIFSFCHYYYIVNDLHSFIRFEKTSTLFYDEEIEKPVEIRVDDIQFALEFKDGRFKGDFQKDGERLGRITGDYSNISCETPIGPSEFKFYRYQDLDEFSRLESEYLLPPNGDNLQSLLSTHKRFRLLVNNLCSPYGLTLGLRPQEHKIELVKKVEDTIISYPYSMISETFRRLIFYLTAVLSNKDSIIIFEEPESHAFPSYVKFLAEKITSDLNNQYFIATHNPYFLFSLVEKAFIDDINVFITYFDDYQTKVEPLNRKKMEMLLGMDVDVFFQLNRLIKKK